MSTSEATKVFGPQLLRAPAETVGAAAAGDFQHVACERGCEDDMRTGTYKGAKPHGAYAQYWPAEVGGRGWKTNNIFLKAEVVRNRET